MEEKKQRLIKLIMELGTFFMRCDGDVDSREVKFLHDYLEQMVEQGEGTRTELEDIKKNLNDDATIEELISLTKDLVERCREEERSGLIAALSDFISKMINADGILHSNEEKFYCLWKIGVENNLIIENNITKNELLKQGIANADESKDIWFIDKFSMPNTIVTKLTTDSKYRVSKEDLKGKSFEDLSKNNFLVIFTSLKEGTLCAYISCPIEEERKTAIELAEKLSKVKFGEKKIEIFVFRSASEGELEHYED